MEIDDEDVVAHVSLPFTSRKRSTLSGSYFGPGPSTKMLLVLATAKRMCLIVLGIGFPSVFFLPLLYTKCRYLLVFQRGYQ